MTADYLFLNYESKFYNEIKTLWNRTGLDSKIRGDNEQVIDSTIKHGGKLILMLDKESKNIIGTSWITNDGRRLYLHHFCIAREHQGKQLSSLLLFESLQFAKEKNMQIKLEVHSENKKALNLYAKNGFTMLGDYKVMIIR